MDQEMFIADKARQLRKLAILEDSPRLTVRRRSLVTTCLRATLQDLEEVGAGHTAVRTLVRTMHDRKGRHSPSSTVSILQERLADSGVL